MTNIEKQIALIILEGRDRGALNTVMADQILGLPSGLEAVKACENAVHKYFDFRFKTCKQVVCCPDCNDTGEIARALTVREALKYATDTAVATAAILKSSPEANVTWAITLSDLATVRVKK